MAEKGENQKKGEPDTARPWKFKKGKEDRENFIFCKKKKLKMVTIQRLGGPGSKGYNDAQNCKGGKKVGD